MSVKGGLIPCNFTTSARQCLPLVIITHVVTQVIQYFWVITHTGHARSFMSCTHCYARDICSWYLYCQRGLRPLCYSCHSFCSQHVAWGFAASWLRGIKQLWSSTRIQPWLCSMLCMAFTLRYRYVVNPCESCIHAALLLNVLTHPCWPWWSAWRQVGGLAFKHTCLARKLIAGVTGLMEYFVTIILLSSSSLCRCCCNRCRQQHVWHDDSLCCVHNAPAFQSSDLSSGNLWLHMLAHAETPMSNACIFVMVIR